MTNLPLKTDNERNSLSNPQIDTAMFVLQCFLCAFNVVHTVDAQCHVLRALPLFHSQIPLAHYKTKRINLNAIIPKI